MLCSQILRVVQDITGLIRSDICAQSDLLPSTYIDSRYRTVLEHWYSLVRKVLADQEVPGKNIGSNKCTGTSACRKPEVQILVPVHELSPDFC